MRKPAIPFVRFYLDRVAQPDSHILDIGCGTAPYRGLLRGHYTGLDLTAEPYCEGFPRDVDLVASATAIPLPAASVDLLFSVAVFYQIPDYEAALREFFRVLRPGGRILLFDYNRRTLRRLGKSDGRTYPCWTQWQLKALLKRHGFKDLELLLPNTRPMSAPERALRLIHQELFRQWAIVSATR